MNVEIEFNEAFKESGLIVAARSRILNKNTVIHTAKLPESATVREAKQINNKCE